MELKDRIENYTPTKYNPYYWWRRFKGRETLHKYQPLKDKIVNGDYEPSDYHWWVLWENNLEQESLSKITDVGKQHEARCLFGERRRRLMNDFEKDEAKILEAMYKDFWLAFRMKQDEVEDEMFNFDGTLLEFYHYIYSKKKQNGN
jgi:hypothetical protein